LHFRLLPELWKSWRQPVILSSRRVDRTKIRERALADLDFYEHLLTGYRLATNSFSTAEVVPEVVYPVAVIARNKKQATT
jgi:hypothetical protein